MNRGKLLYLNWEEMESLGLSLKKITDGVEKAFIANANGNVINPPKHWIQTGPDTWFGGMSCYIPSLNAAGMKWQSGNPKNKKRGLPYILGFYILNNSDGIPLAIMDSTWITGMRTACASALTAKYLARKDSKTIGIIGCGLQGRVHLEAMRETIPSICSCKAYDIIPDKTKEYCETMSKKLGIKVIPVESPRAAVENCDIVITGGPIVYPPRPGINERGWMAPGTLAITIDYDSYWTGEAMEDFTYIITDNMEQTNHTKESGFFLNVPHIDAELGDIIVGRKPGRSNEDEMILSFNLGVAFEDLPTAQELYWLAKEKEVGTWLSF